MTLIAHYDFNEHEEIWLLLPWLANGRLQDAARERALQHARLCERCSQELRLQQQLCVALAVPERISYAPSASFSKLLRRIDAGPAQRPQPLLSGAAAGPAKPAGPVTQHAARLWQPAGLAWAASCLLSVGWVAGEAHRELAPAYQVRSDAGPPASADPVLHLIFVRTLTVDQVESLLRSAGAELAEGPAGEGVFGVRLLHPGSDAARQQQQLAAQLRHDPRVRWVEPLAAPPGSVASSTSAHP